MSEMPRLPENESNPSSTRLPGSAIEQMSGNSDRKVPSGVIYSEGRHDTELLLAKAKPFQFLRTWRFWIILLLGQILSWCIVSTNTLTQYLSVNGANIPAFQTVFNYVLLNLVYTTWTLYKYGFKKWFRLLWKDGWNFRCVRHGYCWYYQVMSR